MEPKKRERRSSERIEILGATVNYKVDNSFLSKKKYDDEILPVVDISRGGIRFLGLKSLKSAKKLSMTIHIPEEDDPLLLKGHVRWASPISSISYRYQIGVQFNTYGLEKGQNPPAMKNRIIKLEKKYRQIKNLN